MFNLGGWEWVILLVIVLIVFGVGRLPEIGGALGKSIREFRESSKDDTKPEQPVEPPAELPAEPPVVPAVAKEEPTSEKPV
jgi:sec-independent protein translocase protein TatA